MELLILTIIGLGIYNWVITSKYQDAKEQINNYNQLIIEMATELESLGSPNVKVIRNEEH